MHFVFFNYPHHNSNRMLGRVDLWWTFVWAYFVNMPSHSFLDKSWCILTHIRYFTHISLISDMNQVYCKGFLIRWPRLVSRLSVGRAQDSIDPDASSKFGNKYTNTQIHKYSRLSVGRAQDSIDPDACSKFGNKYINTQIHKYSRLSVGRAQDSIDLHSNFKV